METKIKFKDGAGRNQEATVSILDYKAAQMQGLSLSQHLDRKFNASNVIGQALAAEGLYVNPDTKLGIRASRLSDLLSDGLRVNAGSIVSPDGSGNGTPAGRLFFPEIILQTINAELVTNSDDLFAGWNSMISNTEVINGTEYRRAKLDITAPEGSTAQSQAQLAEPAIMVGITASDHSYSIPTKSIGLMISEQAMQSSSISLVSTIMESQARGERVRMMEDQISDIISGNTDLGITGVGASAFNADTLDATIAADGVLTQLAWIKYLRQGYQTHTITNCIMTLETAIAIENRTGKPTSYTDNPTSKRIDSLFNVENLGITAPSVFLMPASIVGANRIVGVDRSKSLVRYVSSSANWLATEAYIMRRAQAFAVSFGERVDLLYPESVSVMDLNNT